MMRPSRPLYYRLALRPASSTPAPRCSPHREPRVSHPRSQRSIHSSPWHLKPRRSKFPSVTQAQLDRIEAAREADRRAQKVPLEEYEAYTKEDFEVLARRYSPAQVAAIKAGEEAISTFDIGTQGKLRQDPLAFQYIDDFSRISQTIDKKVEKLRGDEQDYRSATGMPYPMAEEGDHEDLLLEAAEDRAQLENVGEWVPASPKDAEEGADGDQGIFSKLVLRRSIAQVGKAALKRYLGVATVQEAKDYCDAKDNEQLQANLRAQARDADADVDTNVPADAIAPVHSIIEALKNHPNDQILMDQRQPIHSAYFQNEILHTAKYKECFAWAKANPPAPTPFGMPYEEVLQDEAMLTLPDVAPTIPRLIEDDTNEDGVSPSEAQTEAAKDLAAMLETELQGVSDAERPMYERIARQLGVKIETLRNARTKVLTGHYVVNQTMLGKMRSFYALCVAGNGEGMVGLGEGKAPDPARARVIARMASLKHMAPVLRYENRTIFGEVAGKVGAAEVVLRAGSPGHGIRASRHIFEIAKHAGIYDLSGKCLRGRNPMNVAKAVWQALKSQRHPDDIARARGKKLVDVRKVYYSGGI